MIGSITNLFPLSIYHARGGLTNKVRNKLVSDIDASIEASKSVDSKGAWTGDVNGYHNIHNSEEYAPVFDVFSKAIQEYIKATGINPNMYDYYYTRSWGVRQKSDKIIEPHVHAVSHLTGVYYPRVPVGSGSLVLGQYSAANELFESMYDESYYLDGTLDPTNPLCAKFHTFDVKEDLLVLFPSKTPHKTTPNQSEQNRYSISTDILFVLKDANGRENGIPPIQEWKIAA